MMAGLVGLLINVLVLCLILGLVWYVLRLLPLPDPFGQIAQAVIVVIAVLLLIGLLLGYVPSFTSRWH